MLRSVSVVTLCVLAASCGTRPGVGFEDAPEEAGPNSPENASGGGVVVDAGPDVLDVVEEAEVSEDVVEEVDDIADVPEPLMCPDDEVVPRGCAEPIEREDLAGVCNGLDDDCDGTIDEGCACALGAVQPCFPGPPSRANAGACRPGTQRCVTGAAGIAEWGECDGTVVPSSETCDEVDNDCDGCVDELLDCTLSGSCPSPGDPRTPDGAPFAAYALDGALFWPNDARGWRWDVEGGPCDNLGATQASYTLEGARSRQATFTPTLSGDYRVTLTVLTDGEPFSCSWVVHVDGPGLRIEMCYPESDDRDLDLYMMPTSTPGPWFGDSILDAPNGDACGWHNCEARLRNAAERVDWGYPDTDLAGCVGGPQGEQWAELGACANPRLDIDNNLQEGTGLPENINIDAPRDGDGFRVMVQNWTGSLAHPVVNIYCGGERKATFGAAPDQLEGFEMTTRRENPNAMWRVADITMQAGEDGVVNDCVVSPLHPPGEATGYDITYDDARY